MTPVSLVSLPDPPEEVVGRMVPGQQHKRRLDIATPQFERRTKAMCPVRAG